MGDIIIFYPFLFLYIASILWVTRNPPKILIATKAIAKKPKILEELNTVSEFPERPAMVIAPTIITDEIALVTDINGVCNDGVTLHTTYTYKYREDEYT